MEKKIDIISFLAGITAENTRSYQSDFSYDEKRLRAAVLEANPENRTFLWMSRSCGTHCVLEREVFLRETGAHDIWTHYEYDAEHIRAFRVTVAPGQDTASVVGEVQPLNYREHMQRVKRNAIHVQTVEIIFGDGAAYTLPYDEYKRQFYDLLAAHGEIDRIHYMPEKEWELAHVLQTERTLSAAQKKSRRPRKPLVR